MNMISAAAVSAAINVSFLAEIRLIRMSSPYDRVHIVLGAAGAVRLLYSYAPTLSRHHVDPCPSLASSKSLKRNLAKSQKLTTIQNEQRADEARCLAKYLRSPCAPGQNYDGRHGVPHH